MTETENDGLCNLCGLPEGSLEHTNELHAFNYLLYEYNDYRKALVKNRNGIEVTQTVETEGISPKEYVYDVNKGRYTVKITPGRLKTFKSCIRFKFLIKNIRNKDKIYLVLCDFLHPLGPYCIDDEKGIVESRKYLELSPYESYPIYVYFELSKLNIGEYSNHLAFKFQDSSKNQYTFFRNLLVNVQDHKIDEETDAATHFKGEYWADDVKAIPATSKQICKDEYLIPNEYMNAILRGLKTLPGPAIQENNIIMRLSKILGSTNRQSGEYESNLSFHNYADFFHILLWLDEACQVLSLRQYNMSNVTMKLVLQEVLELEVEGLAEKRPSLLTGDLIYIRSHNDHTSYEGVIKTVNDRTIWIHNVDSELLEVVEIDDRTEFDVAFQLSRLTFDRKHKAVDMCVKKNLSNTLFPSLALRSIQNPRYKTDNLTFFNQRINENYEQRTAILAILNETSFPAPYIVFGPPGTGKTVTIVEAILQIKQHKPKSKILICAPSNAACDMLTAKLTESGRCAKNELIRIHAEGRNWTDVPAGVKPFSNHDGIHFTRLEAYQLHGYRIIITTLVLIGKFSGSYTPDYVFVDEAAQAQEPEAVIAISMTSAARVVIAGDPKQLGPVCQSRVAERKGLGLSILERLMARDLYRQYDPRYISKLRLNYRAHTQVLHVPNQLSYDGQLQAINASAQNDMIAKLCVARLANPKRQKAVPRAGFPVEFYSVIAREQRKGKSPSFFNPAEIETVVKLVDALMRQTHTTVKQEDIGIISPYVRQVHRLKEELRRLGHSDVEVGTTEAYQGREKRIVIISTVRGQSDLLLYDQKYDLGFVKNKRRMNVALTRAMSKLIIVGNPMVLNSNLDACKNWRFLIEFCRRNDSVFGMPFATRDMKMRMEITKRITTYNQPKKQDKKQNGRK